MPERRPVSIDTNDYPDVEIDDEDNPEWTEEDFARARPLSELLPDLHARLAGGEKPRAVRTVTLDLDAAVVDAFQARGEDWRERMRDALARAVERVPEKA